MSRARILIAGDLVPTKSNYDYFESGAIEELLGDELFRIWEKADYRMINLEAPLIDSGVPITKSGPNLSVPTRCFSGLEKMKVSCAGLANNHIMDYGSDGLKNTVGLLEGAGIHYVGAGDDRRTAENGICVDVNGIRIGIYACSEHEFSAAGIHTPGANAIGVNTCLRISELKQKSDYVVTLFHGGKEHYPYPTPEQQERCRSFADAGADLVVCQHSHCVGCEEYYHDSLIVYGQGNFIFNYKDVECWKTGLLIELLIKKDEQSTANVTYHPICRSGSAIKYANRFEEQQILDGFRRRGQQIDQVDELFQEICQKDGAGVLRCLAGWGRGLRGLDRFLFRDALIKRNYAGKKKALPLGAVLCETNWEVAKTLLR